MYTHERKSMNIKYFIVTSALVSSISYTMEQTKENASQTSSTIPIALVPKHTTAPQTIHITDFSTPIPFNGTSRPLFKRLDNRYKNKFGNTLVASLYINASNGDVTYKEKGCIRLLTQNDMIDIADGRALYITDIKKTNTLQKDGKLLLYGALLLNNSRVCFSTTDNKAEKAYLISRASNIFQGCYLANKSDK